MKETRTMFMGISLIAVVGAISLNITPKTSLGCGGTEFASGSGDCPLAEFYMTVDGDDWDPIVRKMCFRTFESEARCTVYKYSIVPVTEDAAPFSEPSEEYVEITYGVGCEESGVEGALVENVDGESVAMSLWGVPTRPPMPDIESAEPLVTGSCSTASKYYAGDFELFVIPVSE
ncbi:MAG: hypothetical protein WBB42_07425 [Polyangiales bacterium]